MSLLYQSSEVIQVTQDARIYDEPAPAPGTFEFILEVNVDANSLFTTKTYIEKAENNEDVTISLEFDLNYIESCFNSNQTTMNKTSDKLKNPNDNTDGVGKYLRQQDVLTTVKTEKYELGHRFLEIAAIKIFKSAYATAAIRNDKEFTNGASVPGSIYQQILDPVDVSMGLTQDPLVSSDHGAELSMFNAYVSSGRYIPSNNDQFETREFNFQGTVWEFPLAFRGEIFGSDGTSVASDFPSIYGNNYPELSSVLLRFVGHVPQ
jgi:hypothetical protein